MSPHSDDSQKAVKEHLLKRQQRIQHHHYNKIIGLSNNINYSNSRTSLEQGSFSSLDSQLSPPIQTQSNTMEEKLKPGIFEQQLSSSSNVISSGIELEIKINKGINLKEN